MSKQLPYLAMDGVLCDRPQDGCFIEAISRKERGYARDDTSKEKRMARKMLSNEQLSHYVGMSIKNPAAANRYWARCMGQDSTMDDETAARIKEFLSDKLSDKDHTKLCSMLDGMGDVEAQDTEPLPDDGPRLPGTPRPGRGMDSLSARQRMAADGAKSFAEMFPDAARIKVL